MHVRRDAYAWSRRQPNAAGRITTGLWPGFPSDLVSLVTVLATQAEGRTLVHDWMYELRLFALEQMSGMGADLFLCDPHRIIVTGPSRLRGRMLDSRDLRSGMSLIAAALAADGESRVSAARNSRAGLQPAGRATAVASARGSRNCRDGRTEVRPYGTCSRVASEPASETANAAASASAESLAALAAGSGGLIGRIGRLACGAGDGCSAARLGGAAGTGDSSSAGVLGASRPSRNGAEIGFVQVQHADDVRCQREDDVSLLRFLVVLHEQTPDNRQVAQPRHAIERRRARRRG